MPVTLYQHSDAAADLWKSGIRNLRAYAAAAAEYAATADDADDAATAGAIADALVRDMPDGKLIAGRIPAADVRHLPILSRKVREIAAEIHSLDVGVVCPMLDAEGFDSAAAYSLPQNHNGRSAADMRAASHRCPYCTAADVVRTLRRDGATARDADARWNRKS